MNLRLPFRVRTLVIPWALKRFSEVRISLRDLDRRVLKWNVFLVRWGFKVVGIWGHEYMSLWPSSVSLW